MRRLALLALLAGCHHGASSAVGPAASSGGAPASSSAASASPVASASAMPDAALPWPDFGPPGPIVARGYPVPLGTGMDDPARWAGFTSDGQYFGYCGVGGGRGETRCDFVDASGKHLTMTDADDKGVHAKKTQQIHRWLKDHGVPQTVARGGDPSSRMAPPLTGMWAFARDITLTVVTTPPTHDAAGKLLAEPSLRVGGVLAGEAPVYPINVSAPRRKAGAEVIEYHFVSPNAVALSPDGKDLGVVAHSFCMEYCDDFDVVRVPVTTFAGRVYNDAGYAHHEKGEWARAAALFLDATFADESKELYAYNLACAYARLGDAPHAKAALSRAIAKGGDGVKARAMKDDDFAAVRGQAWFLQLVR